MSDDAKASIFAAVVGLAVIAAIHYLTNALAAFVSAMIAALAVV